MDASRVCLLLRSKISNHFWKIFSFLFFFSSVDVSLSHPLYSIHMLQVPITENQIKWNVCLHISPISYFHPEHYLLPCCICLNLGNRMNFPRFCSNSFSWSIQFQAQTSNCIWFSFHWRVPVMERKKKPNKTKPNTASCVKSSKHHEAYLEVWTAKCSPE